MIRADGPTKTEPRSRKGVDGDLKSRIESRRTTKASGRNSAVECQLPKLDVAGSIPAARSIISRDIVGAVIPAGINPDHVLAALARIDDEGVPASRVQHGVNLVHRDKSYPPKLVISLAAEIATGRRLPSGDFITTEAERVLVRLGFSVAREGQARTPIVRISSDFSDSAATMPVLDFEQLERELLSSAPLFRWKQIRKDSNLPPRSSGVYAWFFERMPPEVPTEGCFIRDRATLLYVGISPKNLTSKSTLRDRLWAHFEGVAESSTLRTTLGCLLEPELGTVLRRVGSGKTQTFAEKEPDLSNWMANHTLIGWIEVRRPWLLEEHLLSRLTLPLNIAGNSLHPFRARLQELRSRAVKRAAELEIIARRKIVFLVSCVAKKSARSMPARALYCSDLFEKSRDFVERQKGEWFILSAKHGLVAPNQVIEPYNETLKDKTASERFQWAHGVIENLRPHCPPGTTVVILAGEKYREFLVSLLHELRCTVEIPMEGLKIGEQLSWLLNH